MTGSKKRPNLTESKKGPQRIHPAPEHREVADQDEYRTEYNLLLLMVRPKISGPRDNAENEPKGRLLGQCRR